jgi:hypothetical protein
LLNDLFGIGFLRIPEVLLFTVLYICLSRLSDQPIANALIALLLTEIVLVLLSVVVKKLLVGSKWGSDHSTPFWSWRHFAYFFAQDCFFVWCRGSLGYFAGTLFSNSILRWMGCQIGRRTIVNEPMQCFDWNAVSFGSDCFIDGYLQYHTFENMTLKVKRTVIKDGCTVNFGATVMGGASFEDGTTIMPLSLVLKETNMPAGTYDGSPAEPVPEETSVSSAGRAADGSTTPPPVDNTDWLKAAAIILVLVDHFGYFFVEDDLWWAAFGRFAAPVFFFLVGYAKSRSVPLHWIGLGIILTVLDSWNADWTWVAPNILLSFALIRLARPRVEALVNSRPWAAYALLLPVLLVLLPVAGQMADYGAEGWLWALFGIYHRQYADAKAVTVAGGAIDGAVQRAGPVRLLACVIAAVIYVWQEQKEFAFPEVQLTVVIVGVAIMALSMCLFLRGASRIQPPEFISGPLRFVGRHTLEIYAVQLAASELIVKLVPGLGV